LVARWALAGQGGGWVRATLAVAAAGPGPEAAAAAMQRRSS